MCFKIKWLSLVGDGSPVFVLDKWMSRPDTNASHEEVSLTFLVSSG